MAKNKKSSSSFLKKPMDFPLLVVILLLLTIGLIMVLSASSPSALSESGDSYKYFSKQLLFAVAGIGAMFAISKFDYRKLKKFYKYAYVLAIILLLFVLVGGRSVNGAKRWIYLSESISFQPSEMVKMLMIIFYAGILTINRDKLSSYKNGFLWHLCLLGPIVLLLMVQPHFSASIVIVGICSIMMIVAGCKFKHFLLTAGSVGIPGIIGMIIFSPYRLQRVVTFLDPWQDKAGDGWQVIQSLYAIGSGGLFGAGLGESKQKFLYIPEPHNDFIFSILGEELGFVGCAIVMVLFAIFIWRGVLVAMKAPDMFGSLLAVGITSLIGIQAIINIAVVTSSMPATGMPLPFFSYGGTALFILLCEMGVLLNISRAGNK